MMMQQELFPREVVTNVPRVTLTGCDRLHIEQHRGLIACQEEVISFQTSIGLISIQGSGLFLLRYSAQEAMIGGKITGVSMQPEGRRG